MKKKTTLTERISVRCTKKEKEEFEKFMKEKHFTTQREFFLKAFGHEMNAAQIACSAQNILNHLNVTVDPIKGVQSKENGDNLIEQECKKIWSSL